MTARVEDYRLIGDARGSSLVWLIAVCSAVEVRTAAVMMASRLRLAALVTVAVVTTVAAAIRPVPAARVLLDRASAGTAGRMV